MKRFSITFEVFVKDIDDPTPNGWARPSKPVRIIVPAETHDQAVAKLTEALGVLVNN